MGFIDWIKNIFETKQQVKITTKDLNKICKEDEPLQLILTDKENKPLSNKKITYTVNGVEYDKITDEQGIASLNINLNPGVYTGLCKYEGDETYSSATAYSKITVSPKLSISNLTMNYKDGSKFTAKATDAKGNPLSGCQIIFTVNGVGYDRTTDSNGITSLNINLNTGVYNITTTSFNSTSNNTITVNPPIPEDALSYNDYLYLMGRIAWWIINNNKPFKKRDVYGYFNEGIKQADLISKIKSRGENVVEDSLVAEFVECAIYDNSSSLEFLPNYVTGKDGEKYYKTCYVDMANRVSAYETSNGASPRYVTIKNNNTTSSNTTTTTSNKTYEAFVQYFGKVTDIDSCLTKIRGKGYSGYFNSRYDNITCIKRMYNHQPINCTDSSQVFYELAVALGYDVQFVHVKCSSGTGHVRLRLKHSKNTEGEWIYRDPASVLNGNSIKSNWCTSNYTLLAYDPAWIFTDLN